MIILSSDAAKDRILEAAGPIFGEKGFEGATVREICQKADVNQAAINYYFGSKEKLYVEVFQRAHPAAKGNPEQVSFPAGATPEEKLHLVLQNISTRILDQEIAPWQGEMIMREIHHPSPACQPILVEIVTRQWDVLRQRIRELLGPDLPEPLEYKLIFSLIGQILYYRLSRPLLGVICDPSMMEQHFQAEQLADFVADFFLAACKNHPELSRRDHADPPHLSGNPQG